MKRFLLLAALAPAEAGVVLAPEPVIFKDAPWRKPEAERFVPEALVKFNVGKVP